MLENFRKKINSVIQNIEIPEIKSNPSTSNSTSIFGVPVTVPGSFIYQKEDVFSPSTVRTPTSPSRVPRSINLTAGFRQLDRNQEVWEAIRKANEKNADMAEELDERIIATQTVSQQRLTNITDLNVTLANLPSVVDQLKNCTEMIEEITSSMSVVEEKLWQLEDLVEVLDLQERQLDRRFEMAMYKEKKMAELDKVRERLAKEHAENVVRHEKGMMKVQKERQLVFQDAFQNDLKVYKETGSVPKITPKSPPPGQEVTLEEIVLDDATATQDLDEFLAK